MGKLGHAWVGAWVVHGSVHGACDVVVVMCGECVGKYMCYLDLVMLDLKG